MKRDDILAEMQLARASLQGTMGRVWSTDKQDHDLEWLAIVQMIVRTDVPYIALGDRNDAFEIAGIGQYRQQSDCGQYHSFAVLGIV